MDVVSREDRAIVDFTELQRPPDEASTLPPECYRSPELYEREVERIFLKEWTAVGRVEDVPNPGDYITQTIADEPIIVVRDGEGEVRAHLNVCRHRGCTLVEGSGSAKTFKCPYHGWMYGLNGELRGAPEVADTKFFDKKDYPLRPVKVEIWEGFIMVNFDLDATSFAERVTEIDRWGGDKYHFADHVTTHSWSYPLDCNWKVYLDNFIEAYHVPWVHGPTFQPVAPLKSWVDMPDITDQPWGLMVGQVPGLSMSDSGDALLGANPDLTDIPVEYDGMPVWLGYPTLMMVIAVDCFVYYVAIPKGPEKCEVLLKLCVPKEAAEKYFAGDPEMVKTIEMYARNSETFILEDNRISALQQPGLRSRLATSGRYNKKHETLLWQFQNWIAKKAYFDYGTNGNGRKENGANGHNGHAE